MYVCHKCGDEDENDRYPGRFLFCLCGPGGYPCCPECGYRCNECGFEWVCEDCEDTCDYGPCGC
ncbi:MAG: hypothetical protein VYB83_02205 [Candidatus Thermoplasmatota archaeon]|nr:hypothetical protein [Candidatus Thermoplasmatota archaeon]